jgi:hypothetical protein
MSLVNAIVTAIGTLASLAALWLAMKHKDNLASGGADRAAIESIPRWSIWLFERQDCERYEREWRAHIWELVAAGEITQAKRDRRRLALAGPVMAVALRARRWIAHRGVDGPKIVHRYSHSGIQVTSAIRKPPKLGDLYELTVSACNQLAVECMVSIEIDADPTGTVGGCSTLRSRETMLAVRGPETKSLSVLHTTLRIDRDALPASELHVRVYARGRAEQTPRLVGVSNVQLR